MTKLKRLPTMDWPPNSTIRVADAAYRIFVDTTDRRFSIPEDVLAKEAGEKCVFYIGLRTDSVLAVWTRWDEETLQGVEHALRRDIQDEWDVWLSRLTIPATRAPRCSTEFVWQMRLRRRG